MKGVVGRNSVLHWLYSFTKLTWNQGTDKLNTVTSSTVRAGNWVKREETGGKGNDCLCDGTISGFSRHILQRTSSFWGRLVSYLPWSQKHSSSRHLSICPCLTYLSPSNGKLFPMLQWSIPSFPHNLSFNPISTGIRHWSILEKQQKALGKTSTW